MRRTTALAALAALAALLAGCATMYPGTLDEAGEVGPDQAVILVAIEGANHVNYLQFCGGFPCSNYRFPGLTNDVVALPVALPGGTLELNSYTVDEIPAGYLPVAGGVGYGFRAVEDPTITIDERGIYFYLILNSDDGSFRTEPTPEILKRAKEKYGSLLSSLSPINFEWPK